MALIISLNVKNISAFETKMGVKCQATGSDSMYLSMWKLFPQCFGGRDGAVSTQSDLFTNHYMLDDEAF
jgi:hypothetical protein